ncbi:MAG: amino acid synthesis family protein [Alphaproteobacteria bacterium]|nr:amino acid synthesis family protein [Alphaproteobacteria bacterium]
MRKSGVVKPPKVQVRKFVTIVEEIWHEGGPQARKPHLRGAIAAVLANPFAGRFVKDIEHFMESLNGLGVEMSERLVASLGGDPSRIEAYGKGAIVGVNGELEHGALWHAPGGYAMRKVLGGAKAIVPSTKKVAQTGGRIDIPIHHREAAYVRSHFDAFEIGVPDAPRPDEIVYILAMTTGPRIHARSGGLKVSDIKVGDGQR